jgi:photosystem II stability/assembly factor-like uncharacterized protein
MNRASLRILAIAVLLLGGASHAAVPVAAADGQAMAAEPVPVSELDAMTHIHGLAVDRSDSSYLLIATHHGLYRAGPDGKSVLVSEVQDFMGFNPHPSDAGMLFASGHPAAGGNLGFIASKDGGKTWNQVSPGLNGPVDFHQMSVSPADPNRIYGAFGGLQVSQDAGKTWAMAGPAPEKLIDLAASAKDPDIVYAATETGLFVSLDAGTSWKPLLQGPPATLVEATEEAVFVFIHGEGLLRASEGEFKWTTLSADWGDDYLLHLAVDPAAPDRLYAATGHSQVVRSTDGGKTWSAFGE